MIDVAQKIIMVLIPFFVLLFPVGIIAGVLLAVKDSEETDLAKKKALKWWMIVCFAGPAVLLFLAVSIWGLLSVISVQ